MEITRVSAVPDDMQQQMAHIYTRSFPPAQREEFADLIASVRAGPRSLFVAQEGPSSKGDLLGFAVTSPLSCARIHALEYLAVAEAARSLGIGSLLLQHAARALHAENGVEGILLEVEPAVSLGWGFNPKPHLPGDEGPEAGPEARRIRFYERNGASLLAHIPTYHVPDLATGEGSIPMRLMWLPLEPGAALSDALLRVCIVSLYRDVYRLPDDHPLLQAALHNLHGAVPRSVPGAVSLGWGLNPKPHLPGAVPGGEEKR